MAIDRNSRYPGRFDAPTTARPQGAFKNRSAPNAKDGSYLERDWANDWDGFFGSLLRAAGMTPNGTPDTALSSQYFDALGSLGLRQATESVSGVSKLSTLDLALAGVDNATSMTPLKVKAVVTALLPKRTFLNSDYIRIPDVPGGLIIQFGKVDAINRNGDTTFTLPVDFPGSGKAVFIMLETVTFDTNGASLVGATFASRSTVKVRSSHNSTVPGFFLAVGS